MKFYSTNDQNKSQKVSFQHAVMKGLAEDGGLFMPESIPSLPPKLFDELEKYSFQEIAFKVAKQFSADEIEDSKLKAIIDDAINFEATVSKLSESLGILELYHGPTLAFKDFGARFMSRTMSHFLEQESRELNILVATSGDTGSAVASGFYEAEGINVFVLYPSGKISELQEKQITTLNKNVTALEIDGTFDDCQKLVKDAFVDVELNGHLNLSSANSINIARLVPQSFYYMEAFKQVKEENKKVIFSVPSGNLGNLTAGLFAAKMGLTVNKYIAATNSNSVFTEYIDSGKFIPRPSVQTFSNAMDVGNPSNLARINDLYHSNIGEISKVIFSHSYNDDETLQGVKEIDQKYNYIIDPHGAVGYLALEDYSPYTQNRSEYFGIVLETAHPSKFEDVVEKAINKKADMPQRLKDCISKEKHSVKLSKKFEVLKEYLISK